MKEVAKVISDNTGTYFIKPDGIQIMTNRGLGRHVHKSVDGSVEGVLVYMTKQDFVKHRIYEGIAG